MTAGFSPRTSARLLRMLQEWEEIHGISVSDESDGPAAAAMEVAPVPPPVATEAEIARAMRSLRALAARFKHGIPTGERPMSGHRVTQDVPFSAVHPGFKYFTDLNLDRRFDFPQDAVPLAIERSEYRERRRWSWTWAPTTMPGAPGSRELALKYERRH
jgi:hypothetical protein